MKNVCKVPACKVTHTKPCLLCKKPVCHHHSGGYPDGVPVCCKCKVERSQEEQHQRYIRRQEN